MLPSDRDICTPVCPWKTRITLRHFYPPWRWWEVEERDQAAPEPPARRASPRRLRRTMNRITGRTGDQSLIEMSPSDSFNGELTFYQYVVCFNNSTNIALKSVIIVALIAYFYTFPLRKFLICSLNI